MTINQSNLIVYSFFRCRISRCYHGLALPVTNSSISWTECVEFDNEYWAVSERSYRNPRWCRYFGEDIFKIVGQTQLEGEQSNSTKVCYLGEKACEKTTVDKDTLIIFRIFAEVRRSSDFLCIPRLGDSILHQFDKCDCVKESNCCSSHWFSSILVSYLLETKSRWRIWGSRHWEHDNHAKDNLNVHGNKLLSKCCVIIWEFLLNLNCNSCVTCNNNWTACFFNQNFLQTNYDMPKKINIQ